GVVASIALHCVATRSALFIRIDYFFFSSRRRHTRSKRDWSSDVCSSDLSEDGVTVHGQLFEKKDGRKNKPAVVFVHGGPQRQILLAWDHRSYYSHSYAMNQYLADQGFVVLSVNYRLGIGYGYHFHKPEGSHRFGASEYKDILAAGKWLQEQPQVDKNK